MSSEKKNWGYAPIRRGLLEHLSKMSDRATKFYIYLHLKCHFRGPNRGWVESSFGDMARDLGCSGKSLQRAIWELEGPYIKVERATSQYGLTRICILKYDIENVPTVDKSVHTSEEAMDRGVDRGVDKSVHAPVHTSDSIQHNCQGL